MLCRRQILRLQLDQTPVAPPCLLAVGPLLPGRDGPQQETLAVVDQRRLPRPGELPTEFTHDGDGLAPDKVQIAGRASSRYSDLLVCVHIAPNAFRAGLLDRRHPRRRYEQAIQTSRSELGGGRPPRGELGVLQITVPQFMAEGPGQAVEPVLFPQVDHLRPAPGAAHDTPHAVAELVALLLCRRAPIGRHVVHVAPTVVPDDVDVLVDVDLVVHG